MEYEDFKKVGFGFILVYGLFILLIAIQISNLSNSYNETLQYLNEHKANIEKTQLDEVLEVKQPRIDEFNLLSQTAKDKIKLIGTMTGTPTFYIDGKTYKGFVVEYVEGLSESVAYGNLLTNADNIILFSSPTCGYCQVAEEFMDNNYIDYEMVCSPIHPGDYEICKESNKYIY